MNDEELKSILYEMEQLYKSIFNANGLVCQIIGDFNTVKAIKERVLNMSYNFDHKRIINRIDIATISDIKDKIAIVSTGNMQYNYIATPMLRDKMEYNAKYDILSSIVDSKVLYPEFRVKRSAYGSYSSLSRLYSYVYTYRDPKKMDKNSSTALRSIYLGRTKGNYTRTKDIDVRQNSSEDDSPGEPR